MPQLRSMAAAGAVAAVASLTAAGCGGAKPKPRPPAPPPGALGDLRASGAGHAYFELYEPAGRPRGTMILFHGGGWHDKHGDARRGTIGPALVYRARGWRVLNVGYTQSPSIDDAGATPDPLPMLRDVAAFYDQARRAFGGPICAAGPSAGGHLAAMLAILRPSLTCALAEGAPLDLVRLEDQGSSAAALLAEQAFGADRTTLARWSPTRRWDTKRDRTAMMVVAADNDPFVSTAQARGFAKADPDATVTILPGAEVGAPGAAGFVHSAVEAAPKARQSARETRWLDRLVPQRDGEATAPPAASAAADAAPAGAACDAAVPRANWAAAPRGDRWRLLTAGASWVQHAEPGSFVTATAGCSGSARWQDEGLSVWAFPVAAQRAVTGMQASVVYTAPKGVALRRLDASLRGFLARPRDWEVGLYASTRDRGPITTPVAGCQRGRCDGLRLVRRAGGALIASPAGGPDPDAVDDPPVQRFALPPQTRRLAWRLTCAAPSGCRLDGLPRGARHRDPLGHPAILSLYRLVAR